MIILATEEEIIAAINNLLNRGCSSLDSLCELADLMNQLEKLSG